MAPRITSDLNLSVVIPTYNRASLLPDAIESTLGQTLSPAEVIVVDDGSTDETDAAVAPYLPRIRYLRQENQGVSTARNRGVAEATGEWIGFLDSDDIWEPSRLEWIQASLHHLPDAGWLITDSILVGNDLEPKPGPQGFATGFQVFSDVGMSPAAFFGSQLRRTSFRRSGKECTVFFGDPFPLLLQGNFVQPSALIVRKDLFDSVNGFDPTRRVAEETDLALRLAVAHPFAILMLPLVRWRVGDHDSLISPENVERLIGNAIDSLDQVSTRRPVEGAVAQARDKHLSRLWRRLAYTQLSDLRPSAARSTLRSARSTGALSWGEALPLSLAAHLPRPVLSIARRLKSRLRRERHEK